MNSQKCTKCGLVAWADSDTCKRCGESLLEQSQITVEGSKPSNVPDVVSCILLGVGAACVAFKDYLGPFGYPGSMLAFIGGLGYSIVRVYRSRQHPQLDRKREATVALVLNALLVMVLGAAVPIYFLNRNPESQPFEWREHVSTKGGYSIQLPDDPEEAQQKMQTAKGPVTLRRVTTNMGRRGEYVSGYYDLSNITVYLTDDEVLELLFQHTTKPGGIVLKKKPIVIDAPNGLTVKALESSSQIDVQNISLLRLYWVRERSAVYMNMATFQIADANFVSAGKFLDSFKLVP